VHGPDLAGGGGRRGYPTAIGNRMPFRALASVSPSGWARAINARVKTLRAIDYRVGGGARIFPA
jgi:hypothetical protein